MTAKTYSFANFNIVKFLFWIITAGLFLYVIGDKLSIPNKTYPVLDGFFIVYSTCLLTVVIFESGLELIDKKGESK